MSLKFSGINSTASYYFIFGTISRAILIYSRAVTKLPKTSLSSINFSIKSYSIPSASVIE